MAERRMFAKSIIDSDAFLEMPLSTQALYFHLAMRADDDGFVNSPRKIAKMLGTGEDEFKVLLAKKFLLGFESGVIVIKHWKIHNYIQKDRYTPTKYFEEKNTLSLDENKSYSLTKLIKKQPCIQHVYSLDTQVRLGKDRLEIGKNRLEVVEDITSTAAEDFKKESENFYGEYANVYLSKEQYNKLLAITISEKAIDLIIKDFSENIETGKEDRYNEDLPNAHFERLKKYWDYRRKNPNKFSNAKQEEKNDDFYEGLSK